MLHKTRGIVLHVTPFSESSVVAKIYTDLFGLQSYLINGVRSRTAKVKSGLLQPLSLLDMVVYYKQRGGLQRIKEMKLSAEGGQFTSIPFDMVKSSMVMFMNEVLYKSLKEEEANSQLFNFIFHSVQLLDMEVKANSSFHLYFLVQLTKYLGFFPNGIFEPAVPVFDLQEGSFLAQEPMHPYYITTPLSSHFDKLMNTSINNTVELDISASQKRELIERLLQYYALHITGFNTVNSNKVLEEVWAAD